MKKDTSEIDYCTTCPVCNEPLYMEPLKCMNAVFRPRRQCKCDRDKQEKEEQERRYYQHQKKVDDLKADCFAFKSSRECTFENDNGMNPKMDVAKRYIEHWDELKKEQSGLLLIGSVGTGKTYMAAAIANALIEREYSVKMTDFISIGNEIFNATDKNAVIKNLLNMICLLLMTWE